MADYYPLMRETYRNNVTYRATNALPLATANADASRLLVGLVGYNVPDNQLVDMNGQLNPNAGLKFSPDDLNWEKPMLRQGNRDELNLSFSGGTAGNSNFVNPFYFSRNIGPIYPVYAYDPNNPGQFLTLPNGDRRWDYSNLTALGLPFARRLAVGIRLPKRF